MKNSVVFFYRNFGVTFRDIEGVLYISANQMGKSFNKSYNGWLKSPSSNVFDRNIAYPVRSYQGLPEYGGGTWFVSELAIKYAEWLSPYFVKWIREKINEYNQNKNPEKMNELTSFNEQATMSSREIAELTGKEHKNVLVDCDKLNANYLNLNMAEISAMETEHPTVQGRKIRQYLLTKMQTMDLMTGYNTELRIKVNRRWEELEKAQGAIDFNNAEHVLMLAQNWATEQKKRIEAENKAKELAEDNKLKEQLIVNKSLQIKQQAPKIEYHDDVINAKNAHNITVIAKTFGMSAKALNKFLHDQKIQYRTDHKSYYNNEGKKINSFTWVPYAKFEAMGLCQVRTKLVKINEDETKSFKDLVWFEKGQRFIYELLKKNGKLKGKDQGTLNF
jgi:anti-repressor protein